MSKLYITEYADVGHISGTIPCAKEPENLTQTVAISGSSTQSSLLNPATKIVRVHTDVICSILFGTNPTATTSSRRLVAGQTEYVAVLDGQQGLLKVAVISNT